MNTLDSRHEWLALKTKTHSNRCILYFFSLQELCLCCMISGRWNSLVIVYLVWISRYCQAMELQASLATLTPSGCSTHHQSWRAHPPWGVNSNYNLIVLHKGSLHCTADQVLSARHLLPAQVCLGQAHAPMGNGDAAGPTATGLGVTWVCGSHGRTVLEASQSPSHNSP